MRRLSICAILVMAGLMPGGTVEAEEGLWCLRASVGRGVVSEICHYRTGRAGASTKSRCASSFTLTNTGAPPDRAAAPAAWLSPDLKREAQELRP